MFLTDGDVRLVFLYNYIYLMRAFSRHTIIGCVGPICCLAWARPVIFYLLSPIWRMWRHDKVGSSPATSAPDICLVRLAGWQWEISWQETVLHIIISWTAPSRHLVWFFFLRRPDITATTTTTGSHMFAKHPVTQTQGWILVVNGWGRGWER